MSAFDPSIPCTDRNAARIRDLAHGKVAEPCFEDDSPKVGAELVVNNEIACIFSRQAVIARGQSSSTAGQPSNYDRSRKAQTPARHEHPPAFLQGQYRDRYMFQRVGMQDEIERGSGEATTSYR